MTTTTRANLLMTVAGVAALVAVNLLHVGCGVPEEPVETAEAAVVSADPCGVTIPLKGGLINTSCTKPGHTTWKCAPGYYSSTAHRCSRAHGTQPMAGSWWTLRGSGGYAPDGAANFVPGWFVDNAIDVGEDGQWNWMTVPRNTFVPNWSTMLGPGWSYSNTDLTPSGVLNGLQDFSAFAVMVRGGNTQTTFCGYRSANYVDQIGPDCFRSPPGIDTYFYPDAVIKSFQVF